MPPPPVLDNGGIIRGTVLGPGGPVSNVQVRISGPGGGGVAVTGSDGSFELRVAQVGRYAVRVQGAAGFRPASATVQLDVPGQVSAVSVRLVPSSLLVNVYNADSGNPLSDVQLIATPADGGESIRGTTDTAGQCYFGNLRPGRYRLEAQLTGFSTNASEIFIPSRQDTVTASFMLVKGPSIPLAKARQIFSTPQLPSLNVRSAFQDLAGNVWFATDKGVAQFDGTNFQSSEQNGTPLRALAESDVRAIAEAQGAMWFGTSHGLRRLDSNGVQSVPDVRDHDVRDIAVATDGAVIFATSAGLYRMLDGHFEALLDGDFRALTPDTLDGALWIVGGPPPGVFRLVGGALESYQPADHASLLGERPIRAVLRTSAGRVLLASGSRVFHVAHDGSAADEFVPGALQGAVTAMIEDARGNLWFGTEKGAVVYDVRRGAAESQFQGAVSGLMNDREGNLWFSTAGGAIRMDLYSFVPVTVGQGLLSNNVTGIFPDPTIGKLWFVTEGGVQVGDGATFDVYRQLRPGTRVRYVLRDRSGQLWFAAAEGIFRETQQPAPPAEGDAEAEPTTAELVSDAPATWLAETPDGRLWAATSSGVRVFNGRGFEPVAELAGHLATGMFVLGTDLWLATARNAVRMRDTRVDVVDVSRGLEGERVAWISEDRSGRIWIATNSGVEVFDPESLRKIDNNAGVDSGENAQALLLDREGFMWVGLAGGRVRKIAFFDGGAADTTLGAEQLGLAGSVVNSIAQDAEGSIWIATSLGAARHTPVRVAPTVSYWIEVDGRPLQGDLVPSGQHTIVFHFHGISMLGGLRYLVRLDGQGAWQLLPERAELEREVSYDRLPHGPHRLEVRAINRDLYGVDAPPVEMAIRIDVPVWRKGWFYGMGLVVLLGIAAGAGLAYRYKTREYTLPPELKTYLPIEPNPYIVGNPIRNEKMFFGREDDFRYVRTKLEGASQGVVVVLCGERRAGKSSILYQVLNGRLGSRFIPVFLDMQEMVVANDREFFRRFARVIAEAVHIDRAEVDGYGFRDPSLNPYHQFVDFLENVLSRIENRTLLVLVDEYELLEAKVEEGRLDTDIFLFIAGLMDSKERLSFIFTGSRRLEERDRRFWRELLRRSFFRKVGFLSTNDARRLVTEPVEGRVVFGRGVVDRIVRLTAGQPFYTQVVCQTAVDYLNEHERNALTNRDLQKVLEEIVDHPLPQMIYFWEGLSPDEKVVAALLAEDLEAVGDQGWSTAGDLSAVVVRLKAPVDLSENTIHLTLEELFRREILEKNAIEGYRFRIDLLRLWIRRSHSIWQVLKER